MCTSAFTQMKSTNEKSLKEKISNAHSINSIKLWSCSKTSKYLTKYAEGLLCDNFDKRKLYIKRSRYNNERMVMKTESMELCLNEEEFVSKHGSYTKFDRLRIVK
jgi:hypothetical protein